MGKKSERKSENRKNERIKEVKPARNSQNLLLKNFSTQLLLLLKLLLALNFEVNVPREEVWENVRTWQTKNNRVKLSVKLFVKCLIAFLGWKNPMELIKNWSFVSFYIFGFSFIKLLRKPLCKIHCCWEISMKIVKIFTRAYEMGWKWNIISSFIHSFSLSEKSKHELWNMSYWWACKLLTCFKVNIRNIRQCFANSDEVSFQKIYFNRIHSFLGSLL